MKRQSHINTIEGAGWYRCKRLEFTGETATWELSRTSRYNFSEAYQMAPHRQLATANDDEQLRAFVRAWGPLRARLEAWRGSDPVETYRKERDRLAAIVKLLASVAQPEHQREALLELVRLSERDSVFEIVLEGLRLIFPIPGEYPLGFDPNIQSWLEGATQKDIQKATEHLVCNLPLRNSGGTFTVMKEGRRSVVRASLGLASLGEALEWMVWQDVFQNHPIKFCAECRGLIDSTYKYKKKFCSYECAHRQSARESARRKREERKKKDGTQKAR
jgi:hypothetical protein